ncbi:hypothetical protein ACFQL0_21540 [Haloplanus litoreus]|uniref:hypothetical protein n=1 Tax=Haloplanus litoreus TaxID=767515 RepID=UPI003610A0D6
MSGRSYEGPALDGTVQYLGRAPYHQGDGETVDVVDDEPTGEETTTNIPDLQERPAVERQSTWADWQGGEDA